KRQGADHLQAINKFTDLYDLALGIEMDPAFAFNWLRFTICVRLGEDEIIDSDRLIPMIWEKVLSPWFPLLV
ncbi:MAG: hypothetical protein P1S60_13855, partial [Anaerolineae bacterium]|nr:hypothetical protein [Anaerolineae bacterium]